MNLKPIFDFKRSPGLKKDLLLLYFTLISCCISAKPQVNADNTVTFRVFAPKADSVKLEGDIIFEFTGQYDFNRGGALPMTKGTEGIWSITIGPLEQILICTISRSMAGQWLIRENLMNCLKILNTHNNNYEKTNTNKI